MNVCAVLTDIPDEEAQGKRLRLLIPGCWLWRGCADREPQLQLNHSELQMRWSQAAVPQPHSLVFVGEINQIHDCSSSISAVCVGSKGHGDSVRFPPIWHGRRGGIPSSKEGIPQKKKGWSFWSCLQIYNRTRRGHGSTMLFSVKYHSVGIINGRHLLEH